MEATWDKFLLLPGDGLLLVNAGVVIYADKVAERECAVDGNQLAGRQLAEVWPEAAVATDGIREPLDASGPVDRVLNWRGHDRTVRLFRTDTGIGIGLLADSTDRSSDGPSRILYERVMQAMSESVLVTTAEPFDRPGPVIVFCNDTFLHETGYSRVEVIGRSPRLIQGPNSSEQSRKQFRMSFEKWRTTNVEIQDYRKDGSTFWTEISFAPVADETGWFTHWVSVGTDTTERRLAEERDRQQRAVVQGVLDSMPSQCVLIDGSGAIVATNRQWDRPWELAGDGESPDWRAFNYLEVCRSGVAATMPNPFAVSAAGAIEDLLAGREDSVVAEYEATTPGGDSSGLRAFRLVAFPLRGTPGAVLTHVDLEKPDDHSGDEVGPRGSDPGAGSELVDRIDAVLDARAGDGDVALIVVGIDNFSDVIDAFGHVDGDRLVQTTGQRLAEHLGPGVLTARLRGEEFVVMLTGLSGQWDVADFLAPMRRALMQPIRLELTSVHASVSFGLVRGTASAGGARDMLRDADSAMRAARRHHRGGWAEFTPTHRADAEARVHAERLLVQAVDNESFELAYQPIVDLEAGRTAGAEALLRIRDVNGDLVPPIKFLSALETGPHIEQVGEWVLNSALKVQARWQTRPGMERHRMSINVSSRQLGEGRFRAAVQRALARHGVPPQNLTVEILEDAIVLAGDRAEQELRELAEMGVGVAIDDFGTGYSAMSYLLNFPVTSVKIDRSFMVASGTPRGLRLLRAAGEVARAVGASSLVEGIETYAQTVAAQAAGIEYGQGYLFGRPAPAGDQPVMVSLDG